MSSGSIDLGPNFGAGENTFTSLVLVGGTSGSLTLTVPSVVTSYSIVFPSAQGAAGTTLQNNGSGALSWVAGGLSNTLASAHIFVGSGLNVATDVAVSGDLSLVNTGAFTVATVGGSSAANIHSAELLANAATNANTVSTIVKRDSSGNFSAGTITASLTGAASLNLLIASNLSDLNNTSTARTNLGVAIGTNVEAWSAQLDAVAALASNGLIARTAANTVAARTITGTAGDITVSNGDGVSGNPTLDIGTNVVTLTGTQTLTNKRVTPRTDTTASSATPAINTDTTDFFYITALAANITSFTTSLSGTPTEGQKLLIRILDNGSARTIAWGASFAARGVPLPSTTVASKYLYVGFIYNAVALVWDCISYAQET